MRKWAYKRPDFGYQNQFAFRLWTVSSFSWSALPLSSSAIWSKTGFCLAATSARRVVGECCVGPPCIVYGHLRSVNPRLESSLCLFWSTRVACPGEVLTLDSANLDLCKLAAHRWKQGRSLVFQAEFSHTSCPQARWKYSAWRHCLVARVWRFGSGRATLCVPIWWLKANIGMACSRVWRLGSGRATLCVPCPKTLVLASVRLSTVRRTWFWQSYPL